MNFGMGAMKRMRKIIATGLICIVPLHVHLRVIVQCLSISVLDLRAVPGQTLLSVYPLPSLHRAAGLAALNTCKNVNNFTIIILQQYLVA